MSHCSEMAELDRFNEKHKRKSKVDKLSQKHTIIYDKIIKASIKILKGTTWQSMNDKVIVQMVIEMLESHAV